ncbi:hypothetical protein EJ05DRAFT_195051 [Pseudovirgaria hyperparasitica]|uniref:Sexual development protein n=1 Tax=Pseudovirgaria hyperparasitica TaxID=470096 RepID=A0A6A6WK08_9PEZI|nr:uncharacterized protein EJ05DRAFT_195051 [Pseudovirgaria hyperparasitica]KAF2762041.1 hypothetical protein EJ05DRAFT_195051 [Pseudovirgaria hyperparasitica]
MKSFTVAALVASAAAAPFNFPLSNGFPSPSNDAIATIQKQAGGPLPNTPLPTELSDGVVTSLQLIAANEIFEVAYFTELYHNITENVPGYEATEEDRYFVTQAIRRIRAQEELHALGANAILKNAGKPTVGACEYNFPVNSFQSAIKLANTFTDVVLGVLPAVQYLAGTNGGAQGPALIPLIGSIEEQEAQQTGWFRTLRGKLPSAAPFLSPTTPEFALSAVLQFIVNGTCPPEYAAVTSAVKSFPPLNVVKAPSEDVQTAYYSVDGTIASGNVLAYITGQSLPVVVAIENAKTEDGKTTFSAAFPAIAQSFSDGLTVAAVVSSNQTFANATQVAQNTVFGPGLIEYQ